MSGNTVSRFPITSFQKARLSTTQSRRSVWPSSGCLTFQFYLPMQGLLLGILVQSFKFQVVHSLGSQIVVTDYFFWPREVNCRLGDSRTESGGGGMFLHLAHAWWFSSVSFYQQPPYLCLIVLSVAPFIDWMWPHNRREWERVCDIAGGACEAHMCTHEFDGAKWSYRPDVFEALHNHGQSHCVNTGNGTLYEESSACSWTNVKWCQRYCQRTIKGQIKKLLLRVWPCLDDAVHKTNERKKLLKIMLIIIQ